MKVMLVGRYTPEGTDFLDMVGGGPRPIMFPETSEDCSARVIKLVAEAKEYNACLLFQAVPAPLGIAIGMLVADGKIDGGMVGALISVPVPRIAEVTREFECNSIWMSKKMEAAVKFSNDRAKIGHIDNTGIVVIVDPVPKFKLSHIEWFDGSATNWADDKKVRSTSDKIYPNAVKEFFERYELPIKWLRPDGSIHINGGNSNEFPDVNDGYEVFIAARGRATDTVVNEIIIDNNHISIRIRLPRYITGRFGRNMIDGDRLSNIARMTAVINEVIKAAGG